MRGVAVVSLALVMGCSVQSQDIRPTITPEAIAASTEPLLFVELTETGQQAIMSAAGRNGNVLTWSTADGRSISLLSGIVVATRGFGFDLMSADVSGTLAAVSGGPRTYERFATYLDGENRTVLRSYSCSISGPVSETINSFGRIVSTARWTETCLSTDGDMQSVLWIAGREIWRAVQSFGATESTILTERLTDT
jgi:hypothetical protein